jgi:hypothetical protein
LGDRHDDGWGKTIGGLARPNLTESKSLRRFFGRIS